VSAAGPEVAVLCGGVSGEREVSVGSGKAALAAIAARAPARLLEISSPELPEGLDPERHLIFPALHGSFGEDGQVQSLLEAGGFVYAGCDAGSSALCFDKVASKERLGRAGLPVAPHVAFVRGRPPSAAQAAARLGEALVLKPARQGSSLGLRFCSGPHELAAALRDLPYEHWLLEPLIRGRELTVGVVGDAALAVVEIRPKSGRFDYESKYTKGRTEYLAPAPLEPSQAERARALALEAFRLCGCRDFARVDLMLDEQGAFWILEINTLPGLKETSLLPMSAAAEGIDFEELLARLLQPARARFEKRYSTC